MSRCKFDREAGDYLLPDGEPCRVPHCRVCGYTHVDGTCPECLASIRGDMREIARLCDSLPEETEHRGVNGEAMMLLGPAADPEAMGHVEASIQAGRLPADYLEHADHELHPLFVLGTHDMLVRDALEHDETDEKITVGSAVDYLDRQLTYLGTFPHLPIEDLARDVRQCRAHLESVLRDGEQVELGAPCIKCEQRMVKTTGDGGEVSYECRPCRRRVPEAQYRYAVARAYIAHADRLPLGDMAERVEVPASTLRRWASKRRVVTSEGVEELPPLLLPCGRSNDGRNVYRVSAVEALRDEVRSEPA